MTNPIVERAIAHYKDLGSQRLEVPEWGEAGKPLVVTWTPLTIRERRAIFRPGKPQDDEQLAVDTLIQKARDEAGKPLFTLDDRDQLLHSADARVIARIAMAILRGPNADDQEKN